MDWRRQEDAYPPIKSIASFEASPSVYHLQTGLMNLPQIHCFRPSGLGSQYQGLSFCGFYFESWISLDELTIGYGLSFYRLSLHHLSWAEGITCAFLSAVRHPVTGHWLPCPSIDSSVLLHPPEGNEAGIRK